MASQAGAAAMQTRALGATGLDLSVIGFGTAQLQMLPERAAIETLQRGFALGVNWVHVAPDYGAVEPWVAEAIRGSARPIHVAATAPGQRDALDPFFGHALRVFGEPLSLYGLGCIDDIERLGEDVWGERGMLAWLRARKSEGRIRAMFCTTHGSASYVSRLVTSGAFDAIMLACNPVGFHVLTYDPSKDQRAFEDIADVRATVLPLAAAYGVSILAMKVLGGGLFSRGRGVPPHEWLAEEPPLAAADLLRHALDQPAVTSAIVGVSSPEEAEEDALAGWLDAPARVADEDLDRHALALTRSLCSHCGRCEPTCSRSLEISSMVRDVHIWNYRTETFMADERWNYFRLHPGGSLACDSCEDRTCLCPAGIDIPRMLSRVHASAQSLEREGLHPGPPERRRQTAAGSAYACAVLSASVPSSMTAGARETIRLFLENTGGVMWPSLAHVQDPRMATACGIAWNGALTATIPLRQNVSPSERAHVAMEVDAPREAGAHDLDLFLLPLAAGALDERATRVHGARVEIRPASLGGAA